jgi:hypothetical protein
MPDSPSGAPAGQVAVTLLVPLPNSSSDAPCDFAELYSSCRELTADTNQRCSQTILTLEWSWSGRTKCSRPMESTLCWQGSVP